MEDDVLEMSYPGILSGNLDKLLQNCKLSNFMV